ncbi:hypothetical protein AGABI2DRAFT_186278 [Agaricus bisporus var. bisporus H97]|uniref:hypothetical protein n=1 Tax=Agaricus bisporus var. bisporus (strain H97 / ATCC MYA-4626 / FGSC 10389) TaxID=936046 RepID=UPI00029F4EEB|nr:hypothetical protein AGABI2DRAFT_186278 [Agaricus bisporus var. bisporus H97]EKV45477.1 hypothetical protein AGABI2DRAFT_186278 [Agaricus bisporus var. bisporus H97]
MRAPGDSMNLLSKSVDSQAFMVTSTKLQTAALAATRTAAGLPADIGFYRSIDSGLAHDIDAVSSRVLNLTNRLLQYSSSVNPQAAKGNRKGKTKLEDQDDVADNFHSLVVDVMDQLFERTDSCLDQILGRNKAPAISINPPAPQKRVRMFAFHVPANLILLQKVGSHKGALDPAIHHASQLPKPQLSFKYKADNDDAPWYPSLTHKYNALVPLGHVYTDADDDTTVIANHPYRYEINHITYPSHVYAPANPSPPASLAETPYSWISNPDGLQNMLTKLRAASEIAVDLEHHSYRTYLGFLCLMQISTREEDFVVDVIALRDEMEVLNEVFTDPKIVKVFHGAESDIVWLQQDFNLYVVNLFDTYHASKLLEFPRHGLANLLEMYCDYIPDKRYQLADWRIRPLPKEMLEYARSDTHFLLFIYDNLRNALLDRGGPASRSPHASKNPLHASINHVLTRSSETCLRVYVKEVYDRSSGTGSNGWDTLARKWNKPLFTALSFSYQSSSDEGHSVPEMQKAVYRAVHWWRESVSREEDESTRYVLPNQYLFRIAEAPPGDLGNLLRLFGSSVPVVVKRRAKELLDVVRDAVKRSLGGGDGGGGEAKVKVKEGTENEEGEKEEDEKVDEISESKEVKESFAETNEKLWGTDEINEMLTAPSSLFSKKTKNATIAATTTSDYAAARSALFGNIANTGVVPGKEDVSQNSHFQELVTKINSTLVIMPSVPKTAAVSSTVTSKEEDGNVVGMQVEIPYIPAAQRQKATVIEEKERDTIVVVGKSKTKKRKRTKSTQAAGSSSQVVDNNRSTSDGKEGEEGFDFSSVPNVLDENPEVEAKKPVKKRQKKAKGGPKSSDFPAPPRAYSEFKGGNQAHTFK